MQFTVYVKVGQTTTVPNEGSISEGAVGLKARLRELGYSRSAEGKISSLYIF